MLISGVLVQGLPVLSVFQFFWLFLVESSVVPLDWELEIRSNECREPVVDRDQMEEELDNKGDQRPLGL